MATHTMPHGRTAVLLAVLCAAAAWALINPGYTPRNLVNSADLVQVVTLAAPEGDGPVTGRVVETLKGTAPAQATLTIDLAASDAGVADEFRAAMGDATAVTALLCRGAFATDGGETEPATVLQVGVPWFTLTPADGRWTVAADDRDLNAVWGGTARRLAAAVRDMLADPLVGFAVKATQTWGGDLALGTIDGAVHGCLLVEGLAPGPPCIVVLAAGGDRVYQCAARGEQPREITARVKLPTASRVAACGDFDGDGRVDLASWTGTALIVAYGRAEGGFARVPVATPLADCRSLAVVDTPAGPGLVAGTSGAPVVLTPDGRRGFSAAALPDADALGPGGLCAVADFTGEGRADILQCFAEGIRLYAGEGLGRFAAPVVTRVALPGAPTALACGDYDGEGTLDLLVGGERGCALLARVDGAPFANIIGETGELEYHGAMGDPAVIAARACEVNNDGRQGMALFYAARGAMTFFSRGYGCFGFARELGLQTVDLPAAAALAGGQQAGLALDLNADGATDLFAVTTDGRVVVLLGQAGDRPDLGLTLALAPTASAPLTVTVTQPGHVQGTYVVPPATAVAVGIARKGLVTATWTADGRRHTRRITVVSGTRLIVEWTTPAGEAKRQVVDGRRVVVGE